MAGREFEVVVVGGGPAGAVAATFLGRAGINTLLVDKARFPRDKACGDAVGGKAVEVLKELAVEEPLCNEVIGRICGETFSSPRGDSVRIPFPEADRRSSSASTARPRDPSSVYVVRRWIFDNLLFQRAKRQQHVTTFEEFSFTDVLWDGARTAGIVGTDRSGAAIQVKCRVLIGADGALSKVAEKVGAYDFSHKSHDHWIAAFRMYFEGVRDLTDNIEIHFVDELVPGYFWIFPAGGGCANVGAGMVETDVRGERGRFRRKKVNLREVTRELITSHPRFRQRFAGATEVSGSFRGWQLPCGSERRKLAGAGWMLTGDAASLIDPFSGEGIPNAMLSGRFAAECAANALRNGEVEESVLKAYEERVWHELGPQLDTSFRLQGIARRRWLLNFIVGRAAHSERIRQTLTEMVADTSKSVELTHPGFYVKMLFG